MLKEEREVLAAQIAEDVISAYEATGWTPEPNVLGGPKSNSGCAVGVLAFHAGCFTGVETFAIFPWFMEKYGMATARFAVGFDHGLLDNAPLPDMYSQQGFSYEYMIGYQVGVTVRTWRELKGMPVQEKVETREVVYG